MTNDRVNNAIVEIFKTNVYSQNRADVIIKKLEIIIPAAKINFDLDDCDNILRVQKDKPFDIQPIIELVKSEGFNCQEL